MKRALDGYPGCLDGSASRGMLLATAAEPNIGQDQPAGPGSAGIIRNSTLMGATILDPQSHKLGQIKDVLFNSQTGQATFVVFDAEVPGSGHAMLVVPYQALRVSFNLPDKRLSVVLNLRPDQVRAAPQIGNNQWQMLQNPQFLQQARDFYQVKTYYAARPIENPSVASPPSVPAPAIQYVVPQPCIVPQPSMNSTDPWAGDEAMKEFSEE